MGYGMGGGRNGRFWGAPILAKKLQKIQHFQLTSCKIAAPKKRPFLPPPIPYPTFCTLIGPPREKWPQKSLKKKKRSSKMFPKMVAFGSSQTWLFAFLTRKCSFVLFCALLRSFALFLQTCVCAHLRVWCLGPGPNILGYFLFPWP